MEDGQILALYFQRDEDAIAQTALRYGSKLFTLADRILDSREDAEESVSDTYLKAWNSIPPTKPTYFFAYLAKICRFTAFGILDRRGAAKRSAEVVALTDELALCIPDPHRERQLESQALGEALNAFLATLPEESRRIFLRRYWYADSIAEIAGKYHITESKVKTRLMRTRSALRKFLEQEGFSL